MKHARLLFIHALFSLYSFTLSYLLHFASINICPIFQMSVLFVDVLNCILLL